jgi:hypothetical protein
MSELGALVPCTVDDERDVLTHAAI